ncbi:uncharacterized protein I303_104864 [Kwoniella dejecticola CBS 10117]|uniref:Uncharacterized protein n=1 Tax=Kwoniella dejecticola CBS 10117 TaxID=1296121 RepID=A0A1A6A449_9TREE|nr:uncharacterized protein I303_04153 [Kwoniella dejecticola CBS 10117]OBR84832.1 hypothetical protein I303_04153 [Kwoniella dejecticola CBS 10117]
MLSFLNSLIFCLLAVSALGSPVSHDTNAARLARGLPLKKPARAFDPTRTVVRRQEPSGAPQTGAIEITDQLGRRKRVGATYMAYSSDNGAFTQTTDLESAAMFKIHGAGVLGLDIMKSGHAVTIFSPGQSNVKFDMNSYNVLSFSYTDTKTNSEQVVTPYSPYQYIINIGTEELLLCNAADDTDAGAYYDSYKQVAMIFVRSQRQ